MNYKMKKLQDKISNLIDLESEIHVKISALNRQSDVLQNGGYRLIDNHRLAWFVRGENIPEAMDNLERISGEMSPLSDEIVAIRRIKPIRKQNGEGA